MGDLIVDVVCYLIVGVALFVFVIGPTIALIGVWIHYCFNRNLNLPKRTEPTDDFMEQASRILDILEERNRMLTVSCFSKDEDRILKELRDSSDVASLVRYAHFAGYHITFEETKCDWKDDPEYYDSKVFKTDLGEAEDLREEMRWNGYKRYHDPPKSPRDRALGR